MINDAKMREKKESGSEVRAVPRSEEDMATTNGIDQDIPPEVRISWSWWWWSQIMMMTTNADDEDDELRWRWQIMMTMTNNDDDNNDVWAGGGGGEQGGKPAQKQRRYDFTSTGEPSLLTIFSWSCLRPFSCLQLFRWWSWLWWLVEWIHLQKIMIFLQTFRRLILTKCEILQAEVA